MVPLKRNVDKDKEPLVWGHLWVSGGSPGLRTLPLHVTPWVTWGRPSPPWISGVYLSKGKSTSRNKSLSIVKALD